MRELRVEGQTDVLVPAYHCGSEVEALLRAGFRCRFYEATESLEPDEDELEGLLDESVLGLYLIHYLGFPQDAVRWRRWCDERGLLLIEDAAQAWLATVGDRPLGSLGDLAIFSFYKSFGLPDGAALVGGRARPVRNGNGRGGLGLGSLAKRHAAWLLARSPLLSEAGARVHPELELIHTPFDPQSGFALGNPCSRPSATSAFLLPRVLDPAAVAKRVGNYERLLAELGDHVPSAFSRLPAGACPFAFPIATSSKPQALERLLREGVRALDFWSVPHPSLPAERFPGAASWRARLAGLPVHQELTEHDLGHLAAAVPRRPRNQPPLRLETEVFSDVADPAWEALAEESGSVFATREWLSTWWEHFGGGRLFLTRVYKRDHTIAILPLYLWASRPLRIMRFLGHGSGDELGPVCASFDRPEAGRALRQFLAERTRDWDLLLAEHLPGRGWDGLLGGRVLRRHGSPVLRFDGENWERFLASRSRNFREQMRRKERRLAREHRLRFRLATDRNRLPSDLDVLFSLHAARWGSRGSAFGGPREAFQREFAACALDRGWLRLWFLELDGKEVAAWYGFRFAGREAYYQSGRDPGFDRLSVGSVLLMHSIRAACTDGMSEYRFLRGDDAYKYRFANADPQLETVALAGSPAGKVALAAGTATRRLDRFPGALRRPLGL
jgi:CelD/BcsL family acetyltransferase involved in cellulose biosynthesis